MAARPLHFIILAAACLSLAACDMPNPPKSEASANGTATAPPASITPVSAAPADASWADPAVAKPMPAEPVASVDRTDVPTADAPPPVTPAAPATIDERVDRLEREVNDMHNDMTMMMPALTKLVAAQADLQQVLNRMQKNQAGAAPAAKPKAAAPAAKAKAATPVTRAAKPKETPRAKSDVVPDRTSEAAPASDAPLPLTDRSSEVAGPNRPAETPPLTPESIVAAAKASSTAAAPAVPAAPKPAPKAWTGPSTYTVSEIRFGEHSNMTRIVLESSGKVPYTYALDTTGMLMTLHLPQTAWKAAAQAAPASSKAVDSYMATPDSQGGTMVAIKLKAPANISWTDTLPPTDGSGHRIVFDLTPRS